MSKIFLDKHDEIIDAVDRIKATKAKQIDVGVPQESLLAQGVISFKLLKRFSQRVGKKIRIASTDVSVRRMSEKAGLPVVGATKPSLVVASNNKVSSDALSEIQVKTSKSKQAIGVRSYNKMQKKREEAQPDNKLKEKNKSKKKKKRLGPRWGVVFFVFVLVLGSAAIGIYFFLPRAEITVTSKQEEFTSVASFTVDASLEEANLDNDIIPGEMVELERGKTETFASTGEKNVGEKAIGTITVYNTYQTTPRDLTGATFEDSAGHVFVAVGVVTVPGYVDVGETITPGEVDVPVEAEEAGEDYNIDPADFIINTLASSLRDRIYAESTVAFSGGSTDTVKAIVSTDLDNAKEELTNQIQIELTDELKENRESDYLIDDQAISFSVETGESNVEIDEEADEFEYTVKIKLKALLLANTAVDPLVEKKVQNMLSDSWSLNDTEGGESYEFRSVDIDNGRASAFLNVTRYATNQLNIGDVMRLVRNVPKNEAEALIMGRLEVESADIELWPFWVSRVPRWEWRINVNLSE